MWRHQNLRPVIAGLPMLFGESVSQLSAPLLQMNPLSRFTVECFAHLLGVLVVGAVWTRFQPIAYAVEKVINSDILGKPRRFSAGFSMDWDLDASPDSSRMVNPALGGGSLLDMFAYPSVWAMLLVHHHPLNTDKDPKVLFTHQTIYPRSGVDINSRWLVEWKGLCQGMLMTYLVVLPSYQPETFSIHSRPSRFLSPKGTMASSTTHSRPLHDVIFEADEIARCIRDGESERIPWEESRMVYGWVDKGAEQNCQVGGD
ncbi:hypothetical protein I305_06289 [Cryptococcus gattii E566]|uniref:GFO/IDH/MocA-like oxidoreductase domain-containing protein n=1 Tax=Cryptococcus gattii EJB2 TaxID=1296103 RepID=A0ABR5BMD6_9TREE|nr:hypothetical protein I306_06235 [Cryptococcus gattii EJB2]KIY31182.1 hypothetical protein I305_06289 [Cryptococcus gattii E566]KJD99869.1 hypothetical protein I311_06547 [Cryptococcus gattii NT-10]